MASLRAEKGTQLPIQFLLNREVIFFSPSIIFHMLAKHGSWSAVPVVKPQDQGRFKVDVPSHAVMLWGWQLPVPLMNSAPCNTCQRFGQPWAVK